MPACCEDDGVYGDCGAVKEEKGVLAGGFDGGSGYFDGFAFIDEVEEFQVVFVSDADPRWTPVYTAGLVSSLIHRVEKSTY